MECPSDSEIVKGCARKSKKCQELLYKRYFGYAMSISLTYTSDRNIALEVTNDSFLKIFNSISKYDQSQPLKSWLRKIVVNTAIDYYRKNKKHENHLNVEIASQHYDSSDVIDQLSVEDIYQLLNELPEIQKMVFNLYEIEGYDHKEISNHLDIPVSSSRTYLARAKRKLRDLLKDHFN